MKEISDVEIALIARADRKADAELGTAYTPEWRAVRDAEKQRLKEDYEANGENSEIGRLLAR
jgi:hypothetical protein